MASSRSGLARGRQRRPTQQPQHLATLRGAQISKDRNVRCEENAGFSWDPKARYGPETVKALPRADDHVREALFDESADQKFDGIPDTGIHRFGSNALEPGYGSAALQKLRAGQL